MQQQNEGSVWIIVAIVAVFAVIFGVMIYQKIKRRNAQWSGVVIDKNATETEAHRPNSHSNNSNTGGFNIQMGGDRRAINRNYSLRIRDTTNKEFSWPVGEGMYMSVNVGDQLRKDAGSETPVVVSQATPTPVVNTNIPPNPPTASA